MRIFVKNVHPRADIHDVVQELSIYGPISDGSLNNGNGFVDFVNEEDAKSCISDALFVKPTCMERPFIVSKNAKKPKKKRKNCASFDEIKFTLSSLEMGNWDGQ